MTRWLLCVLTVSAVAGCFENDDAARDAAQAPPPNIEVPRTVVAEMTCPTENATWSEDIIMENTVGGGPSGTTSSQTWVLDTEAATDWSVSDADCVRAIRVEVTWTNDASGGADLYVGIVVPGTGVEVLGHDNQQYVLDGTHTETVFAPTAMEGFSGEALLAGLEVRLYTQWLSIAQGGLPVNLTVTLVVP